MYLGIVGAGNIVKTVLPVLRTLSVDRIALCGREQSRDKLCRLAAEAGISDIYTDYNALLQSDVDAVYIALPNGLHFSYAQKALIAGKHVIAEKPVVETSARLGELFRLAEEHHCVLLEAMNLHHLPAFRSLKEDLPALGHLRVVLLNYSQYSSRYDAFRQGILTPVFDRNHAGGALMDLNVYNIHAALHLFGAPHSVRYRANLQRGVDTSGVLLLEYDGFQAVCIGAKDCRSPSRSVLQGEDGVITLAEPVNQLEHYEVTAAEGTRSVSCPCACHRLYPEFRELLEIVEQNDHLRMHRLWDYSREAVRILEAARRDAGLRFPCDETETI